jgi:hypothetical protein
MLPVIKSTDDLVLFGRSILFSDIFRTLPSIMIKIGGLIEMTHRKPALVALNNLITTMEANRNQRSYALQIRRAWRDDCGGLKRMMATMGSYIAQLTNIATTLLQAVQADIFVTAHRNNKHPCDIAFGGMLPSFDELKKDRGVQSLVFVDCQLAVKSMHECFEAHNYDYNNLRSPIK